ncbi:MAG: Hpt domain-containing protein [Gemmatimonadota bacterium]
MSRVRAFFVREADECLEEARDALRAGADSGGNRPPDRSTLHAALRRFRGSAQLARYGELAEAVRSLERRLHPDTGEPWVPGLASEVEAALDGLEDELDTIRAGRVQQDPRMETGMDDYGQQPGGLEDTGEVGSTDGAEPAEGPGPVDGAGPSVDVVPLARLEYSGEAALERALTLRTPLEDAVVAEEPVGPILDELFDLISLGLR